MQKLPWATAHGAEERRRLQILQVLGESGPLNRAELAERVGVSRSTLSELVATLLEQRAILAAGTDADSRTGRGRPAERLVLDPDAGQLLGVDFGRGRIHIVIADAARNILASGGEACQPQEDWPARTDRAFRLIDRLAAQAGVHYQALRGVGIGFPGPLSPHVGGSTPPYQAKSRSAAAALSTAFSERFGVGVIVDNNVRFAALGEAGWAPPGDIRDLLYIRLSTGIGGGLIVGGRLAAGASGFAGELGHIAVPGCTTHCRCGKQGCLETVASLPAVLDACRTGAAPGLLTANDLRVAVDRGDPIVDRVLRDAGSAVGRILGDMVLLLDPSDVVLAGELIQVAPPFVEQVRRGIRYALLPMNESVPTIRTARLFDDAGALGALVALLHRSPLLAEYPMLDGHNPLASTSTARENGTYR